MTDNLAAAYTELIKDRTEWEMMDVYTDRSPTTVHRIIYHAWMYVVHSYTDGHLTVDEYEYAYWTLVRAYSSIDKECAVQESWNL